MGKKVIFILIVLLIIPIISSAAIETKPSYSQGETLIARVSGNFISEIFEENVLFYRAHVSIPNEYVRIPMDYDVAKVGDDYYIIASLIGKTQNNYLIKIKGVDYYSAGRATNQDIIQYFSITNQTADFAVDPGFVVSQGDFSIKLQNLKSSSLSINVRSFQGITSQSSFTLSSNSMKTINFQTDSITQPVFGVIEISSPSLNYGIPAYIVKYETPPIIQPDDPYCGDSVIDSGEQCDKTNWGGIIGCSDFGFNSGTLSCNPLGSQNECMFDIANCFNISPPTQNNTNTTNQTNQTNQTNNQTNQNNQTNICYNDNNCPSGHACIQGSCVIVQDEESVCGDGLRDLGEQCDKNDWGGLKGCSDFGFNNGTLSCADCVFNINSCFRTIKDGCIYNSDCGAGEACYKSQCIAAPQCIYNSDCNIGYKCISSTCVKQESRCYYNSDCAPGYECLKNNGTCSKIPNQDECKEDIDCDNDEKCDEGFCIEEEGDDCEENSDCRSGYRCDDGSCVKKECRFDYDCRYGFKCQQGICIKKECSVNFDCSYGFICLNSTCFLREGTQCINNSQCGEGKKCARGNCVTQGDVDVDPGTLQLCNDVGGEICGEDNECKGEFKLIKGKTCCLDPCVEKKKSSTSKIIGWVLIGVIFLIIVWFFKVKAGRTKSSRV